MLHVANREEMKVECRVGNATSEQILTAENSEGVDELREIPRFAVKVA